MSIITMVSHGAMLGNYEGEMVYPSTPAINTAIYTNFGGYPHFANKFYTKTSNFTLTGSIPYVNSSGGNWIPHIGKIDYSLNPAKNEFWIRRCLIIQPGYEDYNHHRDTHLCYFYTTGGNDKLVKSLQIFFDSAADLSFRILNTDGSIAYTGLIAKFANWLKIISSRECFIDVRVKIDNTAGFIQCYDTNGNLAGEYLGTTHGTTKPTHIGLTTHFKNWVGNNDSNPTYASSFTPFAIAADEATFGMYVTPLFCKANGRKQEQTFGDYNKHRYPLMAPKRTDAVSMLLDSAQPKQYTALIQSLTDAAIPDTHEIKAFQFAGLFDADSGTPNKIETALTMCDSNGNFVLDNKKALAINAQSDINANYQRLWSPVYNTSPFTGGNWTKAELSGVEIGFTAYPPTPLV